MGRLFKPGVRVQLAGATVSNRPGSLLLGRHQGPDVRFRVRRSQTSTPDSAEVEIAGLGPDTRAKIAAVWSELGSARLVLETGYDGELAQIFAGDVRELRIPHRSGPVVAVADDGGEALEDAVANYSTIGFTVSQMIDLALLALELAGETITKHPSVDAVIAQTTSAPSIYTSAHVGTASDLLTEAARIAGVRWWVRDGKLYFARRGAPTDGLAVSLPRDRWLAEPAEDRDGLVRVETLLDPLLVPGRQISLVGRTTPWSTEQLVIESLDASGDTSAASPWGAALAARRVR